MPHVPSVLEGIHWLIGTGPRTIEWWQMTVRAVFIFVFALLLVRFGGRRAFGRYATFDIVLSVILGSILSRALTANARFFPTLCAATTLVLLHNLLARLAFYTRLVGFVIKGRDVLLIRDGEIQWEQMKRASITENDLLEALRSSGKVTHVSQVKEAHLERSGQISIIAK